MKKFVEYIVKSLVNDVDKVTVNEKQSDEITVYEIKVSAEDTGKIIGKGGKIANSIRSVVKAAGNLQKKKVTIDII